MDRPSGAGFHIQKIAALQMLTRPLASGSLQWMVKPAHPKRTKRTKRTSGIRHPTAPDNNSRDTRPIYIEDFAELTTSGIQEKVIETQ